MAVFVSLLRGINVSGHKKINMKDLTVIYESLQLLNVVTYIQSGNVVFTSATLNEKEIEKMIVAAIEQHYSFKVPVIVLSHQKLKNALAQLPFNNINVSEQGSQVMFSFLSDIPKVPSDNIFTQYHSPLEVLQRIDDVVYLYCPNGYGKTKLTNNLIEKKLNCGATTRNLKTVIKLCSIVDDLMKKIQ